ncbi:hypothetical protein ACTFIR_005736 [Dictyostelium discoideum]
MPRSLILQVTDFSLVSSSRPMEWESVCSQVTTMFQWSTTQSNMSSNRWSDTRSLRYVLIILETIPQEESQLDWRAYFRILKEKRAIREVSWTENFNLCIEYFAKR